MPASQLLEEMARVADEVKALNQELTEVSNRLEGMLLTVPNIPAENVPSGQG
jgi:seryl-tRNA synthetase